MASAAIGMSPIMQFFYDDGSPVAGGLLYTYLSGTTTPVTTYKDKALAVPNTNPIVLDSAGRCTMYVDTTNDYKFLLKDPDGVLIWSLDNLNTDAEVQMGDVFHFGGDPVSPIVATSYPAGATMDKLHAGTKIYNEDSALLPGTYVLEGMLMGDGASTVTVALVNLTDNSEVALVSISSDDANGERQRSAAITFAVAGAAKDYGIKAKVDTGAGYAWALALRRTA